jgi:small GTP-binding protein
MLKRKVDSKFNIEILSTVGVDYEVLHYKSSMVGFRSQSFIMQLWDSAGTERYMNLTTAFFKKADGILLCYDTTDQMSFVHIMAWLRKIEIHCQEDVPIVMVGTKADKSHDREV